MGILSHKCNIWSIIHIIARFKDARPRIFKIRCVYWALHSIGSSETLSCYAYSSNKAITSKLFDKNTTLARTAICTKDLQSCQHDARTLIRYSYGAADKLSILYEHITVNIFKSCVVLNRQRALYKSYLTNFTTGHLPWHVESFGLFLSISIITKAKWIFSRFKCELLNLL